MVIHRGYSAWIELNGEPLEEYAIETKDRVTSCYVCSEEGAVRTDPPQAPGIRVPADPMYPLGIHPAI